MDADYAFIVAGSGAAGAAAAATLARGGARTLLLEQGGRAVPQADAREALSLYYASSGLTAALGGGVFPVAVGRALGGTTAVNSGTCLRPPEEAVARWAGSVPGFSAEDFREGVEEAWRALKVKPVPRRLAGKSSELFLRGLEQLRLPGGHFLERAEDGCDGGGRCCFVCPSGAKMTSERAFLQPLGGRAPEVRLRHRLRSVRPAARRGGAVEAVVRDAAGAESRLRCRGLVLACGSLATPRFARALGAPSAGDGLSIHPAAEVLALFEEEVRGWRGVPQAAGWVDPGEPDVRYEGAFIPPELAAVTLPLEGRRLRWWLERYDRVAAFGFMIRDRARGRVRYPAGPELPLLLYTPSPEDTAAMTRAMRRAAQVLFAAGAVRVLLPLNRPDNEVDGPAELARFPWHTVRARQLQLMGFHPLGTCGMGRSVGGDLRLAEGVYACDGSVVPESLGVNPQVTIYGLALSLARRLLRDGR